jgi:hypothetical protein
VSNYWWCTSHEGHSGWCPSSAEFAFVSRAVGLATNSLAILHHHLARIEQVRRRVNYKKQSKHLLGLCTQVNDAVAAVIRDLVGLRRVHPPVPSCQDRGPGGGQTVANRYSSASNPQRGLVPAAWKVRSGCGAVLLHHRVQRSNPRKSNVNELHFLII